PPALSAAVPLLPAGARAPARGAGFPGCGRAGVARTRRARPLPHAAPTALLRRLQHAAGASPAGGRRPARAAVPELWALGAARAGPALRRAGPPARCRAAALLGPARPLSLLRP